MDDSKYRKLLVAKAKKLGVPNIEKLTISELKTQITDRGGYVSDDKPEDKAVKTGEVLPPLRRGEHWQSPGVVINVPIPAINAYAQREFSWLDEFMKFKDMVLHMIVGAAAYAVFAKAVGL